MIHFGSNFSLGLITGVCSFIAIIVILLFNKFTRFGKRYFIFLLSAILPTISSIMFAFLPNAVTLIIYNICFYASDVICATVFDIIRNRNLKESGFYNDIAEHQCIIETIFQIARISSYALLILLSLFKNFVLFQIMFVVFNIVSYLLMAIMLGKFEDKYKSEPANLIIDSKQNLENK
jgi:hypothetical protein